jgi:hypothetical protein
VLRLANWTITLGLIVQRSKVRLCEKRPLRYSGETHGMLFLAQVISKAFFGWKEHKKYFHPADRECLSAPALVMGAYTCLNDLIRSIISSPF